MDVIAVSCREFIESLHAASEEQLMLHFCVLTPVMPRWRTGPRTISDHVLYCMVDGEIVGTAAGASQSVASGAVLWTSSGTPHDYRLADPQAYNLCYSLRFRLRDDRGRWLRPEWKVRHFSDGIRWRQRFDELFLVSRQEQSFLFERSRALLVLLCADMFSVTADEDVATNCFTPTQCRLLHRAVDKAENDWPSVPQLAAAVGLNADYFARKFRAHFGCTARSWLVRERIRRAAGLLADSRFTIKEIATRLGYDDQRYFSRQFKQWQGLTPTEYRRKP